MFIKLTSKDGCPLLLDVERVVSVYETESQTRVEYSQPKDEGGVLAVWYVQETAAEILELIDEKQGANL